MLAEMDVVSQDASRVRLIGSGEFSIDSEIFAHIGTTGRGNFLAIAEAINLATIEACRAATLIAVAAPLSLF